MESLYLETSVVSYLTARPSRDLITAARQLLTRDWWETQRSGFEIFISPVVLIEAERDEPEAAAARMSVLEELELIEPRIEAKELAEFLMNDLGLPPKVAADAFHIAVATTSGADYLLTWNFKHIANPVLRLRIESICRRQGYQPPVVCTPEDLIEGAEP